MKLPIFDSNQFTEKRILVRIDLNVPIQNNEIVDDFRIKKILPLIKDLLAKKIFIVFLSHLTERKTHRSFRDLVPALERACGTSMTFASDIPVARALQQSASAPSVILLENLRAVPGEEQNDPAFAKELASLGDIFVNEDFSQSHRSYASMITLPKLLPSFIGPLFQTEIEKLSEALVPPHPFLLILGGIKFETKLGVLTYFLPIADRIFIGGALPFNASSRFEAPNVFLPFDTITRDNRVVDAGPQTLRQLEKEIAKAAMVVWNGPLGLIEKGFDAGTNRLARALAAVSEPRHGRAAASSAKVIVGGGDTVSVIHRLGLIDKFYHVSTGGGAMLAFLATGTLPALDALLQKEKGLK